MNKKASLDHHINLAVGSSAPIILCCLGLEVDTRLRDKEADVESLVKALYMHFLTHPMCEMIT